MALSVFSPIRLRLTWLFHNLCLHPFSKYDILERDTYTGIGIIAIIVNIHAGRTKKGAYFFSQPLFWDYALTEYNSSHSLLTSNGANRSHATASILMAALNHTGLIPIN